MFERLFSLNSFPFNFMCTDGAARDSSSLFLVVGQFDVSLFVFSGVSEDRV